VAPLLAEFWCGWVVVPFLMQSKEIALSFLCALTGDLRRKEPKLLYPGLSDASRQLDSGGSS